MALTESKVKNLNPEARPFKVSDERGLYLEVTSAGGKLWRFRYRFGGQEKKLSIGCYPEVRLKEARQAAYEARQPKESVRQPKNVGHSRVECSGMPLQRRAALMILTHF